MPEQSARADQEREVGVISPMKLRGLAEAFRCNPSGAAGMARVWEVLEECEVSKPKGWALWSIPRQEQWVYRQLLSMAEVPMHDVVLLHRCYPSTPHGVGPWLPAP